MIQARFFIGDKPIEYSFDETSEINEAINTLSMMYWEQMNKLPVAIFLSFDLYKSIMTQNIRVSSQVSIPGFQAVQFMTSLGVVMVKPVLEPKERFIYAGDQQGYEHALIDKKFEEIILGIE